MLQRNDVSEFCIITPTEYLEQFAAQSTMHLVLAHLVDTDEKYAEFYRNRSEFKIMDNGAFELGESYAPDKLIELGKKCNADAIVLPDYPSEPSDKTKQAAIRLINDVKDNGFYTMFVPQSRVGDLEDWITSYTWAAQNNDIDIIGMSILGVPNAIPHIPRSYARVVMTQLLIDRGIFNFDKYHHYLGLNAGARLEVPALIEMDALDSCDSSNPVWSGISGFRYDESTESFLPVRKEYLSEVDFHIPLSKKSNILEAIQHNIDLTLSLFDEGHPYCSMRK